MNRKNTAICLMLFSGVLFTAFISSCTNDNVVAPSDNAKASGQNEYSPEPILNVTIPDVEPQYDDIIYSPSPIGTVFKMDLDGNGYDDAVELKSNCVGIVLNGTVLNDYTPWPGYGLPNGWFMKGDFNNDGREDLVHCVLNSNYVHVWLSNGNGTFYVTYFSPWPSYSINNYGWGAGDFNGDGKCDLVHLIAGGYVHTWFSNGDGTFNVTTHNPGPNYPAVTSGSWFINDWNGDNAADLIHDGSDYYIWLSNWNGSYHVFTYSSLIK